MMVKPILFNTKMVRAILAGGKTVTRRLIKKPVIERDRNNDLCYLYETENDDGCFCIASWKYILPEIMQYSPCHPGDILYVRETWREYNGKYYYKADECPDYDGYFTKKLPCAPKWRPSIHMPKEAARIWLKVTDVRVERLQDMTEDDVCAEGAERIITACEHMDYSYNPPEPCYNGSSACKDCIINYSYPESFGKMVWDSTIKKKDIDKYGWAANPGVWVIEFERTVKPE